MPREKENETVEAKEALLRPEGPEKHHCNCDKDCPCHRRHLGAKLVVALLIFLAGFGSAMLIKCMSHRNGCCAHHQMMSGKHFAANLSDGAGNTIIINTDGSCTMKSHRPLQPKGMKKQPYQQIMTPPQQMHMPIQNMATMPIDESDDE